MPARLPWPKIPKQPAKKRCSTPSRSTYCAARKRTSACAAVCRTVPTFSDLGLDRLELVLELRQLAAAGHQARELLKLESRLLEDAEALAAVQDHEAVADRIGVVRVVCDEDDSDAAV